MATNPYAQFAGAPQPAAQAANPYAQFAEDDADYDPNAIRAATAGLAPQPGAVQPVDIPASTAPEDHLDRAPVGNIEDLVSGRLPDEQLPETSFGGALKRGIEDLALMGGVDEIEAGGGTLGNYIGRALGLNQSQLGLADTYREILKARAAERAKLVQADEQQHPAARLAGQGAGLIIGAGLPAARVARMENMLSRVGAGVLTGGGYGAIAGALSDNEDRTGGALQGAGIGAAIGGALPVGIGAVGLTGRALIPFAERTGLLGGGERSGLNALARRVNLDTNEIQQRAQQFRDAGVNDFTLADLVGEQARGVIAAAARRNTPGRQAAVEYANARRVAFPERVQAGADIISPSQRSATQLSDELRQARTQIANEEYDAIRGTVVPVTDDVRRVLDTGAGRRALSRAIETSDSPEEIAGFLSALKKSGEPSEIDRLMQQLPEGMAPEAREAVRQQLLRQGVSEGEALPSFTLDMLDRVKRDLQATMRSPDASGRSRQYQRMVDQLTAAGDDATGGAYGTARGNFQEASGLMEATQTGERFLPTNRLRANPADFADEATRLSPDERAIARATAAEGVRTAAGAGVRPAMATAEQLAISPNQLERGRALLGPEAADQLSARMQAELDLLRNATDINPRAGSATALRQQDDADLARTAIDTGVSIATGGKWGLIRAIGDVFKSSGIRNIDAERLVRDALDPDRANDALSYLSQRVGRSTARRLLGQIRESGTRMLTSETE